MFGLSLLAQKMKSRVKIGTLYELKVPQNKPPRDHVGKHVVVTQIIPTSSADHLHCFNYEVLWGDKIVPITEQTDDFFFSWFEEVEDDSD